MKRVTFALLTAFASSAANSAANNVDSGASLYQNNCAQCHGAQRQGGSGPSLVDEIWQNGPPTRANLVKVIRNGVANKGMPAWKGTLSAPQIDAVAGFLQTKGTGTALAAPAAAVPAASAPASATPTASSVDLTGFKLPKGFTISVFADNVNTARALAVSDSGTVYVGSRAAGKVYALRDANGDGVADEVITVAENLNAPIGLTLLNGALYVAEMTRVIRFDDIERTYAQRPAYKVVKSDFPTETHHGEKIIKAGPDGKLYIPIGAPCNVCDKENAPHTKIYSMNPDGSNFQIMAKGIRNSVGFAFHPSTRELWFTDNNRDEMGDNTPSCELNRMLHPGMHFGFPYCHGGTVLDPVFGQGKRCDDYEAPVSRLMPHSAPLGLAFNTGTQFPQAYRDNLFIALHGSWNRTQKSGYSVNLVTLSDSRVVSDTPFIEGFLRGEKVVGRPVDVAFQADGSMLVSDDMGGRIYRVTYRKSAD